MLVDAYSHCGLSKYEPIEKVRETMAAADVHRAVLVQHLGEYDNEYLGRIAAAEPSRFASVCLVDAARPDAASVLEELAKSRRFRGVRLTTESLAAAPALFSAAADLGLIIVLYAPEGAAKYANALVEFFLKKPAARMVLTHFGSASIADGPHFASQQPMLDLAEFAGVYFQVSGMKMSCPWPHEAYYPLLAQALEAFGSQRLLWGSNYPVVGSRDDYIADLQLLLQGKLPVPPSAIPAIAGGNARRLWFGESN